MGALTQGWSPHEERVSRGVERVGLGLPFLRHVPRPGAALSPLLPAPPWLSPAAGDGEGSWPSALPSWLHLWALRRACDAVSDIPAGATETHGPVTVACHLHFKLCLQFVDQGVVSSEQQQVMGSVPRECQESGLTNAHTCPAGSHARAPGRGSMGAAALCSANGTSWNRLHPPRGRDPFSNLHKVAPRGDGTLDSEGTHNRHGCSCRKPSPCPPNPHYLALYKTPPYSRPGPRTG